jgi:predicted RNA binding protein YcfA (HicA-like mRNA interferase family)
MSLPRDVSADQLVKALGRIGYVVVRQTGSHIRLTTRTPAVNHVTVPNHYPIKVGTLGAILNDVAAQRGISKAALARELDL